MNKIILTGRLTKDPEIRYTQKGKVVAQFTLAVDRPFTNQDGQREADFINNVAWGKTAEVIGNHVHKGHKILSEGRLQIRQYTDKNGAKRYATEVIVNNIEFLERKQQAGGLRPQNHRPMVTLKVLPKGSSQALNSTKKSHFKEAAA